LNVWLVGDGHRWAAGAILLLGSMNCGLGSPGKGRVTKVLAIATGSLTPLSLLVVHIVVLWAISTFRHARPVPRTTAAAWRLRSAHSYVAEAETWTTADGVSAGIEIFWLRHPPRRL
jgi:hypothetical protein